MQSLMQTVRAVSPAVQGPSRGRAPSRLVAAPHDFSRIPVSAPVQRSAALPFTSRMQAAFGRPPAAPGASGAASGQPVQRVKDAHEIPGIQTFGYQNILGWNGQAGSHDGVDFINDKNAFIMHANGYTDQQGKKHTEIHYNPDHLKDMAPEARYFAVMHELSHLHYQHPGNQHQDSVENETQADDAAVVNAVTLNPLEAENAVQAMMVFIQKMEDAGYKGGGSHPDNLARKQRLGNLMNVISSQSTLDVELTSNYVPKNQMDDFLVKHAAELQIEPSDVKTFTTPNGEFSYLSGQGTVNLANYVPFAKKLGALQNALPGLSHTAAWNVRPATVQQQVKDQL